MKMRSLSVSCSVITLMAVSVFAQNDSTNAKLDTLVAGQKKIMDLQEKIYAEVYDEPLAGKSVGIELNPAFLLLGSSDDAFGLATGFHLFAVDRKAEIAFPIYYYHKSGAEELTHMNIDFMYRRFLGKHQDGFYISVGLRYTHLKGKIDNFFNLFGSPSTEIVTQNKIGAHFGIGYRYFSHSGFFWGTSIYAGRYFSGDEKPVANVFTDDSKQIYDFEILKFGIAF